MKSIIHSMLVLSCWVALIGCGGGNEEQPKIAPSNLNIESTVSTDGSGLVTIHATAENAASFIINFDEVGGSPVTTTTGNAEYTYKQSGTHDIKVTAYSADFLSLSATKSINIEVDEPVLTLVWKDDFDGMALNTEDWTHEIGGSGWGNNELQYYQPGNTSVVDGNLVIEAKKENVGGKAYTSSRIITQGKREFKYGRIDIRAKLPKGQGIWPALWMLGAAFPEAVWPSCGEIDIMEMVGGQLDRSEGDGRDNKVYGTPHWSNAGNNASYGGNTTLSSGIFADDFHVFSITWDETYIKWYLNDVQFHVIDISPAELSEFRQKFFLIFNVAVGGNWPGSPNETTVFPQKMYVDYIKVYQYQ